MFEKLYNMALRLLAIYIIIDMFAEIFADKNYNVKNFLKKIKLSIIDKICILVLLAINISTICIIIIK